MQKLTHWISNFLKRLIRKPIKSSGETIILQNGDSVTIEDIILVGHIIRSTGIHVEIVHNFPKEKANYTNLQPGDTFFATWKFRIVEEESKKQAEESDYNVHIFKYCPDNPRKVG